MKNTRFIPKETRQKVINLFLTTADNTAPSIAKKCDIKYWTVNSIIDKYLKEIK